MNFLLAIDYSFFYLLSLIYGLWVQNRHWLTIGKAKALAAWELKKTLLLWIQGQVYTAVILATQMALFLTYNCFQNW